MTIRELITKLGFDIDDKPLKQYEAGMKKMQSAVGAVSIAATAAAASIFGIAAHTAHTGEEIKNTSEKLGIATDQLQKLQYAAAQSNQTAEEFTFSMGNLNRHISEARKGTANSVQAFQEIGGSFDFAALKGGDTNKVLESIAETFKNAPDGPKKTALAMELFGRGGARMIPLLNKGRDGLKEFGEEAERMGIIMNEETIHNSEKFNKALNLSLAVIGSIKNLVGGALLTPLTEMMQKFAEWVAMNREMISSSILEFMRGLADILGVIFYLMNRTAQAAITLAKPLGGLATALKLVVAAWFLFRAAKIAIAFQGIASSVLLAGLQIMAFGSKMMLLTKAHGLIHALRTAWMMAGNAAFIAQLKMAAIGVLIAAAIALVLLAIEDVVGFFQGKDSVTGIIVEKFKAMWDVVVEMFMDAGPKLLSLMGKIISDMAGALVNGIKNIPILGQVLSGAASAAGAASDAWFGLGRSPAAAPALSSGGNNMSNTKIEAPITITVPEGTPPGEVGNKSRDGISKGLDSVLRGSSAVTKPALLY